MSEYTCYICGVYKTQDPFEPCPKCFGIGYRKGMGQYERGLTALLAMVRLAREVEQLLEIEARPAADSDAGEGGG